MVEFALVTPILLMLILGVFQVGLILLTRMELTHAAQQAVAAGAREASPSNRCAVVESSIGEVYPGQVLDVDCIPADLVTVTVSDNVLTVAPFGPWTVTVSARAVP